MQINFKPGSFQLVVKVGSREVPAYAEPIRRDDARRLQKSYRVARPDLRTRVVKVPA